MFILVSLNPKSIILLNQHFKHNYKIVQIIQRLDSNIFFISTPSMDFQVIIFLLSFPFHSSGTTDLKEILNKDFVDSSLYYGGYALTHIDFTKEGCLIGGNIYDNNYKFYSLLIIPQK